MSPLRKITFITVAILTLMNAVSPSKATPGVQHSSDGPVIELSPHTLEAIDSGISLTFICDFAIIRRWLFMNWPEQSNQHRFVISKHALSDRYLVHIDDKATPHIFRSSSQGVAFIGKSAQNLFYEYANKKPKTELRISLSKYELPAPIRLSAYTSKQWNFDSGWAAWQSED